MLELIGRLIARYLQKETPGYKPASLTDATILQSALRPGDILLVEGNRRISIAIKYLTQSTWSHAAVYVGPCGDMGGGNHDDPPCLIEADVIDGVISVPLSKYAALSTRICRPVGLTENDTAKLLTFLKERIGVKYDTKNVIDLLRYLLPQPPVPTRWRRKMLALGSGHPTRAICSTLIAQAFQSVHYPILPEMQEGQICDPVTGTCTTQEILDIRHHSLFTPRDFDISPYFQIVKPTLEAGFDYKKLNWSK